MSLTQTEAASLGRKLIGIGNCGGAAPVEGVIRGDAFAVLPKLPQKSFDLLFADPPYNLEKKFGSNKFKKLSGDEYEKWLDSWLRLCVPLLKETASVYICGDWGSSAAIQNAGSRYFTLRNRTT
jgi:site-specific DNA-methyltransferase (adenine-specific)